MWFNAKPSDISFIDAAPHRIAAVAEIQASPQEVFDIFATSDHQHIWMKDFVACRWTSEKPHGVGSTRDIELKMLTARERFLIWEPGKRLTFSIDATTIPVTAQSVEDMRFEPIGDGSKTRLVWHVFYAPAPAMIPLHPVFRAVFSHLFTSSAKNLANWVKSRK
jgi:uncharacterized protein YndB with AHSA1/START domain